MEKFFSQKMLVSIIMVLLCVIAGLLFGGKSRDDVMIVEETVMQETTMIKVYVSGAVAKPGVYCLLPGSRVPDAIAAAGGMAATANTDKVNMAKLCKDGMQIYIPEMSKAKQKASAKSKKENFLPGTNKTVGDGVSEQISINTATEEELIALPGIGKVTAQRIIEYRAGKRFSELEDLMKVKGIGKVKFKRLEPYIKL